MSKNTLPPFRNLNDFVEYCVTLDCEDTLLIDTGFDICDPLKPLDEQPHPAVKITWARFKFNG